MSKTITLTEHRPADGLLTHASQKHNLQRQHLFQSECKEHIGYSNAKNHPKRSESWQFLNLQQHLDFLS